jgi:hypothetical protein
MDFVCLQNVLLIGSCGFWDKLHWKGKKVLIFKIWTFLFLSNLMLFGGQNAHFNQIFTINKENYLFYFGKGHKILHITFFSFSPILIQFFLLWIDPVVGHWFPLSLTISKFNKIHRKWQKVPNSKIWTFSFFLVILF